jgi:hypothetical protein
LASPRAFCRLLDEPFNMLDRSAMERGQQLLRASEGGCSLVAVPASSSCIGSEGLRTARDQGEVQDYVERCAG